MNLLVLTDADAAGDDTYVLTDTRADHIRLVLKRGLAEKILAGLLDGPIGDATITSIDPVAVKVRFTSTGPAPMPPLDIDLICAISRPQTIRKVLLTSATMGVRRVHFVRANRTEKSYLESPVLTPEKMRPLLLEGLSQGKFTRLPQVFIHPLFRPFAEDTWPGLESSETLPSNRLLCEVGITATLAEVWNVSEGRVVLAVGPEGGWVPFEIDHFTRLGFTPFLLGPWTLRVETAVTAALAQIELIRALRATSD